MKRLSVVAAVLLGINSILSQTILIRELLPNFSGNELSMGIIFAVWLTGGSLGSLVLARIFIERIDKPADIFAIAMSALSIIMPSVILLARTAKWAFGIPVYETVSPLQILYICGLVLLPLSCILSFCFILCCKMLKDITSKINAPGFVYILEALGATIAGAAFSFLLAGRFNSFQIVSVLVVINFSFLVWFSTALGRNRLTLFALLIISIAALSFGFAGIMQIKSQKIQWHSQEVLSYADSAYGNISVTRSGESINFYENGSLLFTSNDEAFDEEFSHLVMLQHDKPEKVLLIGGGIGGVLGEILKHSPQEVTYLELDPLVIDIGKNYISDKDRAALIDRRVNIRNEDGPFFIKRTKQKFDIIIVNLPDPKTLQLNRFYTKEFYQKAHSRLLPGGLLACRLSSKESIISDELARYNASVYKTLRLSFPAVSIIPGETLIFIASDNVGASDNSPQVLIDRFAKRNIQTDFFTPYHIKDRYYPDTVEYLQKRLKDQYDIATANTDSRPICFYYDIVLWGISFHPHLVLFFNLITGINLLHLTVIILILFLAGLYVIKIKKESLHYIVPSAIAVSGAIGITLEIIIILSFQINYGYAYGKVGLLIALFMLGLALGGYIMNKSLQRVRDYAKLLSFIILISSIYAASFPIIIKSVSSMPLAAVESIFYLMILLAGAVVGSQFPVGVAVLQDKRSGAYAASLILGSDFMGAAVGILISSLIIIPVLGIFNAALVCALAGASTAILLTLSRRRLQQ